MMKLIELASYEQIEQVSELYRVIWNSKDNSIKSRMIKHKSYKRFKGFVILSDENKVLGFSYGYSSLPGQFYHELLAKEFKKDEYQYWLQDCFEFVELAVHPSYRKKGLGTLLIEKLLEDLDNKTAILTTQMDNKSARSLYDSLHWKVLKAPFYPSNTKHPYVIMGKEI